MLSTLPVYKREAVIMYILELEILSNDLTKTEKFYSSVLGLQISEKSNTAVSFLAGHTIFTFKYVGHLKPIYHVAFNIPNNQLNEAIAWMEGKVEIIDAGPGCKIADFVNWNAKSIYFYDYNGNIIEFIARYDLDNKSDQPFSGASISCVSEIGLATDNVAATCNALSNDYNLLPFSKQPRLPKFAALGDDNGLIILSELNRMWHLTEYPAQKYHTKILVKNNNQIHRLVFYVNERTNN